MIVTDEIRLDVPRHLYLDKDDRIIPGVTRILRAGGFIDEDGYKYIQSYYRDRGRDVHMAIHLHEKGTIDWFSVEDDVHGFVESYEKFKRATGYQSLQSELIVHHPLYNYAGSLDQIGVLNGQEVLIDFKTGDVPYWTALQTAAYNACLPPPTVGRYRKRFGLRLYGDGSLAKLKPFNKPDDEPLFLGNVASFWYKVNAGHLKLAESA